MEAHFCNPKFPANSLISPTICFNSKLFLLHFPWLSKIFLVPIRIYPIYAEVVSLWQDFGKTIMNRIWIVFWLSFDFQVIFMWLYLDCLLIVFSFSSWFRPKLTNIVFSWPFQFCLIFLTMFHYTLQFG
jgi:hypothetical protein